MESGLTQMHIIKPRRHTLCSSLIIPSKPECFCCMDHAIVRPVSFVFAPEANSISLLPPPPLTCENPLFCPLVRLEDSLQAMQW